MKLISTYNFKEKDQAISSVNSILNSDAGESVVDYIISIFDFHKKNTINLYSALLQAVIGRKYNKVIACLIDNKVLKVVSQPIDGVISTGYQLNIIKVLKEKKTNHFLNILLDSTRTYASRGLNESKQAMVLRYNEYLRSTSINMTNEEFNALDDNQKRNVSNIINNVSYTKFDKFSGRLHTNITLLKKELRKRILIDGEETTEIDICSSHAQKIYHLGYMFNLDQSFKSAIEKGDIYKFIAFKLKITRDQAKLQFATTLNSKSGGYVNRRIIALFPQLFKEVERLKFIYGHKHISKLLQMSEFRDVINISEQLAQIGIKHFTVHDSFLVKKTDAELVQKMMLKFNYKTK